MNEINENFEETVLAYGIERAGFAQSERQPNRAKQLERFVAYYGVSNRTCAALFMALQAVRVEDDDKLSLIHFLITLVWLKTYVTELVLAGMFQLNENTVRKWIWKYSELLASLKASKISLDLDTPVAHTFLYSVDGTHCRILEPRTVPDKQWFSHKLNKPAVAYEVALHLYRNKVAWINGPFKAGESDLSIYRKEDGLKSRLPPGKLVIADKGYPGEVQISIPNNFDSDAVKKFKQRARARQESFNSRIKEFKILSSCFRSNHELHHTVFNAVCVIVQFDMEVERPLMEL